MASISRRSAFLALLALPLPGVLAAQDVDSGLVEEEIPMIGFTIQRKDSTSGASREPARTAPQGTPGRNVPVPKAEGGTPAKGEWRDTETAAPARPKLRRVMLSLGGGDEPIRDLKEPPLPLGEKIPYDWDARVLVRLNGISLRLQLQDRFGFKSFALNGHLRVDPFVRTGTGHARNEVFDWANKSAPDDKQGFLIGFQASKSDYWGYSADYDKLDVFTEGHQVLDLVTSVGAGYTPLGLNKGKRWNVSLNTSVNYEDIRHTVDGIHLHESGVGYGFGPVFQYGLDWVPIPGFSERFRVKNKIKLTRIRLRTTYSNGTLHPETVTVQADVVANATRWVRLTAGLEETYLPGSGRALLNDKVQLDIIIHFLAVKW